MLDVALINQCADPSLKPAIVEQFVEIAGSFDPLAVTVKSDGRLILVPKAANADEAMEIIRRHVRHAVVRVGLTQFPAGVGVKDASELKSDLVEPCANLRMGTAMFAKILRIVSKWYGDPNSEDAFSQLFEDAVYAWKTGEFEGVRVFQAEDPGEPLASGTPTEVNAAKAAEQLSRQEGAEVSDKSDLGNATIRVDLSRLGVAPR